MKEFIQSKTFKIIAAIIGVFLIAVVSFGTGIAVGLRKAKFSYAFGQNYEQNFIGQRGGNNRGMMGGTVGFMGGMMRQFEGRDFRNTNGLVGTIISVTDNNLVVKDKDNKENTVAVADQTLIKSQGNDLKVTDLKVNDRIVIMGKPGDNGVINADLIRVFNNQNN